MQIKLNSSEIVTRLRIFNIIQENDRQNTWSVRFDPPHGHLSNNGNSFEIYKIKLAETSKFYWPSNLSLFLYCFRLQHTENALSD